MDKEMLIGMCVMDRNTHSIGIIIDIRDSNVIVDFHGIERKFAYPAAFASQLELEDEFLQDCIAEDGKDDDFFSFKRRFFSALNKEIHHLKINGGNTYKAVDGECIASSGRNGYLYAFDLDSDMHFPDGTAVKVKLSESIIYGTIVSCEEFSIIIRLGDFIGQKVSMIEFTTDACVLLETLIERLDEISPSSHNIAYEVACLGRSKIQQGRAITRGQNAAFNRATTEKVTFIWGPPGTGKTETLSDISLEHLENGKRVLMLSYSNVSVDGALLRVNSKANLPAGQVIRYGYPRLKELLESKTLTSYQFVLNQYPHLADRYQELIEQKKGLKQKDPERLEINKKIKSIRKQLDEAEKELIQNSAFVATTISKAIMDKALYSQTFDVVIFDEASMAYIPQIVFAASLAKSHFVCLGDFRQLSAIVQNHEDTMLQKDIFEHTGITTAVENHFSHEWLVLLDIQHRMHEDIADFASKYMYDGLLSTDERIMDSREVIAQNYPVPGTALTLLDLSSTYSVCITSSSGSRINLLSALVCIKLAEEYVTHYEVGIITPYRAQSQLILAMIRDLTDKNPIWKNVSCATVHQFQGSEKSIVIFDAVDCYRMPYPSVLLTSQRNSSADRLFNVAITRAKGKFVLVANKDYLKRKKISNNLLFGKLLQQVDKERAIDSIPNLIKSLSENNMNNHIYIGPKEGTWDMFIEDLLKSRKSIQIDIPGFMDENDEAMKQLSDILETKLADNISITIRMEEDTVPPPELHQYTAIAPYVAMPIVIIDKKVIWYGHPLSAADFVAEGEILETQDFPCIRFEGSMSAKVLQVYLNN